MMNRADQNWPDSEVNEITVADITSAIDYVKTVLITGSVFTTVHAEHWQRYFNQESK